MNASEMKMVIATKNNIILLAIFISTHDTKYLQTKVVYLNGI